MGAEHVVLGSDLPTPMATPDPVGALRGALTAQAAQMVASANAIDLFGINLTSRVIANRPRRSMT
jgi:hypothetical protein